jgi:hypothetical protein
MTDDSTTVRSIFFDSPEDAATALDDALRSTAAADEVRDRLGPMAGAAKEAVLGEVGKVAAGVLETDVTEIFRSAWTKHTALCAAAEASLDDPAGERVIPLATHSISFEQEPGVAIRVANLPVATVTLHVQLDIAVHGLLAVVEAGWLTRVRTGAADVSGVLEVAGQPLLRRQKSMGLRRALILGSGIQLARRT